MKTLHEKIAAYLPSAKLERNPPGKEEIACWLDPSECWDMAAEIMEIVNTHISERLELQ